MATKKYLDYDGLARLVENVNEKLSATKKELMEYADSVAGSGSKEDEDKETATGVKVCNIRLTASKSDEDKGTYAILGSDGKILSGTFFFTYYDAAVISTSATFSEGKAALLWSTPTTAAFLRPGTIKVVQLNSDKSYETTKLTSFTFLNPV